MFHAEKRYSDARAIAKNAKLATQLATRNFLNRPSESTKAAEVAAGESFRLAGPTGLEPATSGVTGRRSNGLSHRSLSDARRISLQTLDLAPKGRLMGVAMRVIRRLALFAV